jgi:hypothetical protein
MFYQHKSSFLSFYPIMAIDTVLTRLLIDYVVLLHLQVTILIISWTSGIFALSKSRLFHIEL